MPRFGLNKVYQVSDERQSGKTVPMADDRSRDLQRLGLQRPGFIGTICGLDCRAGDSSLPPDELELQLVEMGFLEGARVEVLHQGAIRSDPIAVRVNNITVALRRREAMGVLVE